MELRTGIKLGVAALVFIALSLYLLRNVLLGTPTIAYAAKNSELLQSVAASGRVISPQRVTIALQGSSRVQRVVVAEGQTVEAGQLLIELDNSKNRAGQTQAHAIAQQARKTLNRNRNVLAQGFISQTAVDQAQRAVDIAASQVASAQAQVKSTFSSSSDFMLDNAAMRKSDHPKFEQQSQV